MTATESIGTATAAMRHIEIRTDLIAADLRLTLSVPIDTGGDGIYTHTAAVETTGPDTATDAMLAVHTVSEIELVSTVRARVDAEPIDPAPGNNISIVPLPVPGLATLLVSGCACVAFLGHRRNRRKRIPGIVATIPVGGLGGRSPVGNGDR